MKKEWIGLVLLVCLLLTACGGNGGLSEEREAEEVTVVLDWVPNTNHTGLYVAIDRGYFEEEGIDADIIQPTHGGSADLIAAGQGDFGIGYQEQVTYARTADDPLPIKAIAAIIQHNTSGFASPAEKGIKRPGDFEGHSYGGWGSPVEESMLRALMENDGADFSQLDMVNIGTSDFFDSVENHVDFTWIYYGWDGIAAELKEYPINFILLQDYEPALNFYTPVIIASEATLEENPQLARRFLRAVSRGYSFAIDHPEEAAEILLNHVPELDRDMVVASQQFLAQEYQADAVRWGEMDRMIWATYAEWMHQQDLLSRPLDPDAAYTNDFLPDNE